MQSPEDIVTAISIGEGLFYAACFVFAAISGMARTFFDSDYRNPRALFGLCWCAGILACLVISFLCGRNGGASGSEFKYVFLAGILGVAGKECHKWSITIATAVFRRFATAFDVQITDDKANNANDQEQTP